MDLLDTILRACKAEQYLNNFRENDIDTSVLKILVDEDLEVIGINEADIRARILKNCTNLQISTEKKRDLTVDGQYMSFVLSQIKVQLNKHLLNLTCALRREDLDVCYITVEPAVLCLDGCLRSLEERLVEFENHGKEQKLKLNKSPCLLFGTLGCTFVVMLACAKYWKWQNGFT